MYGYSQEIQFHTILQNIMKALKYKPSAQFAYNYSIDILSKCSNNFTSIINLRMFTHQLSIFKDRHINLGMLVHRSSIFEGQHFDQRSLKVNTLIFKSRQIDIRRSRHRSSKVVILIIDHRSSKVDTSISEGRHIDI